MRRAVSASNARMMSVKIPKLPVPSAIRAEIERLKARIGELKALLPAAEQQDIGRTDPQADGQGQRPIASSKEQE